MLDFSYSLHGAHAELDLCPWIVANNPSSGSSNNLNVAANAIRPEKWWQSNKDKGVEKKEMERRTKTRRLIAFYFI